MLYEYFMLISVPTLNTHASSSPQLGDKERAFLLASATIKLRPLLVSIYILVLADKAVLSSHRHRPNQPDNIYQSFSGEGRMRREKHSVFLQ